MDLIGTLSKNALRVQRRESLLQVGYDGLGSRNGYCVDNCTISFSSARGRTRGRLAEI